MHSILENLKFFIRNGYLVDKNPICPDNHCMRRKDREITDKQKIIELIKRMKTIRLALNSDEAPYIVPLSFGMECENGMIIFYVHSAIEGRKIDLIRRNRIVGFEMDTAGSLMGGSEACSWTTEYASVIGTCKAEILEDEELKKHGLEVLMKTMTGCDFVIPQDALHGVAVIKLSVLTISAKANGSFIDF